MRSNGSVRRYVVCAASELPPGRHRVIRIPDGPEIGVFNVGGEFFALKNTCPHHGGPLCEGVVSGTSRARFVDSGPPQIEWLGTGGIVRCPWHGWEFDIKTGVAVCGPRPLRTASYLVHVGPAGSALADDERVPGPVESYEVDVEDELVIVEIPR
jgi:3-phenylpropionate/trans-cinnamate dioxygenase ferredoxin subunit